MERNLIVQKVLRFPTARIVKNGESAETELVCPFVKLKVCKVACVTPVSYEKRVLTKVN